jgi:hypothetical protein
MSSIDPGPGVAEMAVIDLLRSGPESRPRIENWEDRDFHWERFIAFAEGHGLSALLYHKIKSDDSESRLPAEVIERLRQRFLSDSVRALQGKDELHRIGDSFSKASLDFIVLKGPHLAAEVYASPGLRPYCDFDILVIKEELERARDVLVDLGYRPLIMGNWESSTHHIEPLARLGRFPIELHCHVFNPRYSKIALPSIRGLWDRSRVSEEWGPRGRVLAPTDLLSHLGIHMSIHHCFNTSLLHAYDFIEVLRKFDREIDWEFLEKGSEFSAYSRQIESSVALATFLFGEEDRYRGSLDVKTPELRASLRLALRELLTFGDLHAKVSDYFLNFLNASSPFAAMRIAWSRFFPVTPSLVCESAQNRGNGAAATISLGRIKDLFAHYVPLTFRVMTRNRRANQAIRDKAALINFLKGP